jgi:23S rRNA (cytosine1962-C5)-methyltransferase
VWSFESATIDAAFIAERVRRAVAARREAFDADHDGGRLVHAESDGLPGVIADRYGDVVVVQLLAAGAEAWRDVIVKALAAVTGAGAIVERSDADVRALEGLEPRVGVLRGRVEGPVEFREAGLVYAVDVLGGQKTGFYLDQRDNRRIVGAHARGREVLNAFCYTGGFTLAALAQGAARVVSIDSSAGALALARANLARNPALDATRATWIEADVFAELRRLRDRGESFDLVVLDPPKFAPTAQHAARAARAYKDINLFALRLLRPGGLLATFSCSGGVSADLFQKIVAGASLDANTDAAIVGRLGASADHPVALSFPEGDYLKGLLVRRA